VTPARRASTRRKFGLTWWGNAWVETLEQRARLDRNRLARGRTYLRQGRVGQLAVERGEVRAGVRGSGDSRYLVRVVLRQLTDEQWETVLDAFASQVAHAAALLDGELPPDVVATVADAGIELLPGPGEVRLRCTCPDRAEPCKHAAAVSYLVADVIDADPFALLLLRGRSRQEVLDALRARRGGGGVGDDEAGAVAPPGEPARDAWARWRSRSKEQYALPVLPRPPRRPGHPAPLASDPPSGAGIRRNDLSELAAGAARRAWALLHDPGPSIDGDPEPEPVATAAGELAWWERPLSECEQRTAVVASAWFHHLRTVPLPKSFPLVVIQALYEADTLLSGMSIDEVAARGYAVCARSPNLARDLEGVRLLEPAHPDRERRREWWRRRGLNAWVDPGSGQGRFFRIDRDVLVPQVPFVPTCEAEFADMTLDIVLDRLARYVPR
jgi:uncharacterized Zn finger protein